MSNQHLARDDSDFLLVTEEGFLQRHRSLALTAVVLLVLLALVVAWELFTVGSGQASGPSASQPARGGLLPTSATSPSAVPPSAQTPSASVAGSAVGPSRVVIERTVTATVTATAPAQSIVPDVFKLTTDEAANVLRSVGLVPTLVASLPLHGETTDIVTKQEPAAGSQVSPGSTVSIFYFKVS